MICTIAVTFEFETRPPVTSRMTVKAGTAASAMRRAVKEAQEALRPVGWTSCVCVIVNRATAEPETASQVSAVVVLALFALLLALTAAACGTPTAPTRTQIGRNVDGAPHYLGDAYQPWVSTNVTTGDNRLQHPPTP